VSERAYRIVDGRPRTTAIVVDGREVPVDGPEVTVTVDGRPWSDADLTPSAIEEASDEGLAWTLTGPTFAVRMVVEADRGAGVVRKRAEVSGRGRLTHVELERWAGLAVEGPESTGEPMPYNAGPVGLGQPLFGPGLWTGIEHPVAENLAGDGATCALPLAVDLGAEPYVTPATVVGAGGLDEFWDYVDTLRPVPPRLVALSNNWYHLGAPGVMDEAAVRAEIDGFAGVAARHGLALDFVALDDGWEGDWVEATGLWGRAAPARFPSGLAPLGPGIGLWLSPFGGYGARRDARLAWAAGHGYEIDRQARALCAAGARYRAHLSAVLSRWAEEGVGYFKLDGVSFACAEPNHGHAVGPGARTAQVDSFRRLVDGIRAIRPDAVVAFTIGSHPSPWWLSTVDFVWRGGLDDTAADQPGSRLDRFDTYIDTCLQAYRPAAMPVSALVAFSIVETPAARYRDGDDLDGWARHCWLAVGRGTLHHDLYVAPDSLSAAEWAVLAEALAWARERQHVLARSRMVLGDPAAGEIYGFAARLGDDAIVGLRNPSADRRSIECDWPALLGRPPSSMTTRHGPAVTGATVTLAPFEVVLVEARLSG
jgi:hypothetical protein